MRYYSSRSENHYVTASEAVLKGLAPDGGLFVPEETPQVYSSDNLPSGSYQDMACEVFSRFLDDFNFTEVQQIVRKAYNPDTFDHPAVTPLVCLNEQVYVLELWHGPTSAFKDVALQALPHLLSAAAQKSDYSREIVILTATSGDTGKSALEGFRDVPGITIIVYFPEKGVSEIQKLQMTTQEGSNVHVIAVRGNFDHTQSGVKQIFSDRAINRKLEEAGFRLSSANSINWGRLLPQLVYYFSAYRELLSRGRIDKGDPVNFVVPTGNFGNILAGYYARRLGLPVNRLICAANRNNVLSDFINSGIYDKRRTLYNSLSPSMDILVSSNLERLLFELTGHDAERIRFWMNQLNKNGYYKVNPDTSSRLQQLFWSDYADDDETLATVAETYREHGYLVDPHTAVGKKVLDKYLDGEKDRHPSIVLSTASPYKFTGSTIKAIADSSRYKGCSELELIKILEQETGAPVPENLAELEQKPVLHRQTINPDDMPGQLQNMLISR